MIGTRSNTNSYCCLKCGWKGDTAEASCPRCHGKLQLQSWVRAMGGIMVVFGGFAVVTMGGMIIWLWYVIEQTGKPGAQISFDGTKGHMFFAFGVMFAIFAFALLGLINGLIQVISAKRNLMLTSIILGIFAAAGIVAKLYLLFF